MSVAAVAARDKAPILLTNGNSTNQQKRSGVSYYVVGGEAVVSSSLVNKFGAVRLSGSNRYRTNKVVVERFYSSSDKLVDALTVSSLAKGNGVVFVSNSSDKSILKSKSTLVQVGGMSESIVNSIFEGDKEENNQEENKVDKSSLVVGNDYAQIMRCEDFPFEQYKIKATDIDGTDITHKVKWIGTGGPDMNPLHEIDTRVAGGFPIEFYVTLKDGRVLYKPGFLAVGTDYFSDYPLLTADNPEITVPIGYNLTLKDFGLFCWDTAYGNITNDISIAIGDHLPSTEQPGTYKFKVECINESRFGSTLELTVHVK